MSLTLYRLNEVPKGFLQCAPRDLHQILPGPTLIELPGKKTEPLYISTLLHGNETTGIYALQKLLAPYVNGSKTLPRTLLIFIGNVAAAKENLRHLPGQVDYNRVWNGVGDSPEHKLIRSVLDEVQARTLFASIDIHNNTGWNPYYGCINKLEPKFLHLAKMFSNDIVYFTRPYEVQSLAFAEFTTSVTIECGQSDDDVGVERMWQYLEDVLALDALPENKLTQKDVNVFHSITRVTIPDHISFGFDPAIETDLRFIQDFEQYNFIELPAETLLGWQLNPKGHLVVTDELGHDVTEEFISFGHGEIRTQKSLIPSMFCKDERVIRQDCLGYLMARCQLDDI